MRFVSRKVSLALIGAAWLGALAWLTLTPQGVGGEDSGLPTVSLCLICGVRGTADAALNVLLFAPLGLLFAASGKRVLQALGAGLLLSSSIELAQLFIPGRYSSLGDIFSNTSGAALGALLWSTHKHWLPGGALHINRLRVLSVVVPPVVVLAFGWLMQPIWPPEPYWGQLSADLGFMTEYDGEVVEAHLDSVPIPSGRIRDHRDLRKMLAGDWDLAATVVKGRPPRSLAPIISVYNRREEEVVLLGALRQDLVYREWSRARSFRLDQSDLRLPGAMATASVGDTMRLSVERRGPSRCLVSEAIRACPGFTPGRVWSLLFYLEGPPEWVRRSLDALCMFVLFFPVGFWSRRGKQVAGLGVVTGILIGLAVAATRLVAPPWTEVGGAVLGLIVGYASRRLAPMPSPAVRR